MSSSPLLGGSSRPALLQLYRRILRACESYPSRNRERIYQSIREEWREHKGLQAGTEQHTKQIALAYKGLEQLQQFDEGRMTGGNRASANWSVSLEQNPMPKPADYDERKKAAKKNSKASNPILR